MIVGKFISYARSLIGTKWRHRGRTTRGVDCLGLVVLSLLSVGYAVKDNQKYGREPWKDGLQEGLVAHFGEPITNPKLWLPGDIALLKLFGENPNHVGILCDYKYGGLSILHSYSLIAVTEHRLDDNWEKVIVEVYRPWR